MNAGYRRRLPFLLQMSQRDGREGVHIRIKNVDRKEIIVKIM